MGYCTSSQNLITEFISREKVNGVIFFYCDQSDIISSFWPSAKSLASLQSIEIPSRFFYSDHRRIMFTAHYHFAVIADLKCPTIDSLLDFCSCQSYFNSSYRWLLFDDGTEKKRSTNLVSTLNLNIDSHVTMISKRDNQTADICDVYGTVRNRGGAIHLSMVGLVDSGRVTFWNRTNNAYNYRKDLDGVELHVAITTQQIAKKVPYMEHFQSFIPPRKYSVDRLGYRLTMLLSKHLNFKCKLIFVKSWSYDVLKTNSSKGIIGQLQQKLVDFAVTPLALTPERVDAFDFTIPISDGKFVTIFRHPKKNQAQNIFLLPFEDVVWIAVLLVLIISGLLLLATYFAERGINSMGNFQFLLTVFGYICQQGYSGVAIQSSTRITLLIVVIFSFLIYQFYATFIIGYLLVLPPKTIRTLEQLLASNLKYSIEDLAYNRDYFNRTNITIALELYERKVLPNKQGFVNVSTGIELVKQGGYAFHCDSSYGYTLIADTFDMQQICELQEIILYPFRPLHIPIIKGSPLKELFRVSLQRFREIGVSDYYSRKFRAEKLHCMKTDYEYERVYFSDIVCLLWVLAGGMVIASGVLLMENVVFHIRRCLEMREYYKQHRYWLD
ncbi:ionotropic receptor 75a-like [Armigeres subalbatus]|uniref:ionotropic receptor 75a-like n=1 Tax=Armigeres subalbatus TaxID=124917 RepID=UPI002ED64A70